MTKLVRDFAIGAMCVVSLALASATTGLAMQNPTTGQPGAPANTCGPDNPVTPGNSANAPGSPFNPDGQAGKVYAIDTETGKLVATVRVGRGPHGLCVWPQPGRYSLGHTGIMR